MADAFLKILFQLAEDPAFFKTSYSFTDLKAIVVHFNFIIACGKT